MSGTLVIVDMQEEFKASQDLDTITAVKRQITTAKRRKWGIVDVNYGKNGCGLQWPTDWRIRRQLTDYCRHETVVKKRDDGSTQILAACLRRGFEMDRFILCGVNTCSCVFATLQGLMKRRPNAEITMVQEACNCNCQCAEHLRYAVNGFRNVKVA
jgi:nicotinamidase-related amidase